MRQHYRTHTAGTNVNGRTLLTTDYLNHFNEVIMLLEMVPAAPEDFILQLLAWEPRSYRRHFEISGFRDHDLAVLGYEHAPARIRTAFDETVSRLQTETVCALAQIGRLAEAGRTNAISRLCEETVPRLHQLVYEAAAIVNDEAYTGDIVNEEQVSRTGD